MLEIVVGLGVIGVLLKMNHTLGSLVTEMKFARLELADHETRLREGGL